jgi:hypothetical protein
MSERTLKITVNDASKTTIIGAGPEKIPADTTPAKDLTPAKKGGN